MAQAVLHTDRVNQPGVGKRAVQIDKADAEVAGIDAEKVAFHHQATGAQHVGEAAGFAALMRQGCHHVIGQDDPFAQERGADSKGPARAAGCGQRKLSLDRDPFGGTHARSPRCKPYLACGRLTGS